VLQSVDRPIEGLVHHSQACLQSQESCPEGFGLCPGLHPTCCAPLQRPRRGAAGCWQAVPIYRRGLMSIKSTPRQSPATRPYPHPLLLLDCWRCRAGWGGLWQHRAVSGWCQRTRGGLVCSAGPAVIDKMLLESAENLRGELDRPVGDKVTQTRAHWIA